MLVKKVFKKQMKEFAIQMMEEYAKSTDNDIVPNTPPWLIGYVHPHHKIQLEDINETRFDGVTDHNIGDYVKAAEKHFAV